MRGWIGAGIIALMFNAAATWPAESSRLTELIRDALAPPASQAVQAAQSSVQSAAPIDIQPILAVMFHDLSKLQDDQLYVLAVSDACSATQTLNCHGIPSADAKRVVTMALEQRKAERAEEAARTSRYISSGGFGVSLLSLFLSAYGAFSKKRRGDDNS